MKHGERMKLKMLQTGIEVWHKSHKDVTARNIARVLGMAHTAVYYHFPLGIEKAVAKHALKIKDKTIIIQMIAMNHPVVSHFTPYDKLHWLNKIND